MTATNNSLHKRIEWIDYIKGLAILLVIVGHTLDGDIRGMIFSFHMPLFFICSGATFKFSKNRNEFLIKIKRATKTLLLPAIFAWLLESLYVLISNDFFSSEPSLLTNFVKQKFISLLFSSGVPYSYTKYDVPSIGIIWFVVVLFWSRSIYDFINLCVKSKYKYLIYSLLTIIGLILGTYLWLPFSLDIALACLPFFILGSVIYKLNLEIRSSEKFILCTLVWILCFFIQYKGAGSYLELCSRTYPRFPICYICAFAGTIMLSELGIKACHNTQISKPICFLGQNSMTMLIVHILDYSYFNSFWNIANQPLINCFLRLTVDFLIFLLISVLKRCISKSFIKVPDHKI